MRNKRKKAACVLKYCFFELHPICHEKFTIALTKFNLVCLQPQN